MDAIRLLAQKEGIFLDPVYSGKAFHGLLEMAKNDELPERVCFWHTGGAPALFAMS
jgi:1-aminocyclopropane-1-carboxylate deaminase/D-cysteine desulfhydrase-like pyridoxal-dependent ACC family enzyme